MKPDNLGNQRGVQIAASFGRLDILYFFTTHFRVGTLREPALYRVVNINAGTVGGSRQGLDDTCNAAGFIISATDQKFLRESAKVLHHRFLSVISDTPNQFSLFKSNLNSNKCTPGGAEVTVTLLFPPENVSSASGVSRAQDLYWSYDCSIMQKYSTACKSKSQIKVWCF